MRILIDARFEVPCLRRAAVLLERARQDADASNERTLRLLCSKIESMQRLAVAGRPIRHSTVERVSSLVARIEAPQAASTRDARMYALIQANALAETRAVLARLASAAEVHPSHSIGVAGARTDVTNPLVA